jgi:predicted small lipoprotein YifL
MSSQADETADKSLWLSAVVLAGLMTLCGCAAKGRPEVTSAESPRAKSETFGEKFRTKGTDTLPFWYSDKSREISRSLGSGD